jgi:threonine dehydratase
MNQTMTQSRAIAVTRERIASIHPMIAPHVRRTPVASVSGSDFGWDGVHLSFKLEQLQHAGSFKTRGAFTNLLTREVPKAGVVAASGGNHGVAVAYVASQLGVPATIFLPRTSSPAKMERIRGYGAQLIIAGDIYGDALAASEEQGRRSGALAIHAFDRDETMLGQGTLALELERQAPDLDTVLVAVGGGGLISGIAAWYRSEVTVIGVEPELAPTLTRALEAGRPVDAPTGSIAVDSLAPTRVGERGFPIMREHVDRVVLVSDDDIRQSQQALWQQLRIVAEPGGAAAFAALLSGKFTPQPGARIGIVVSGGNTVAVDFGR